MFVGFAISHVALCKHVSLRSLLAFIQMNQTAAKFKTNYLFLTANIKKQIAAVAALILVSSTLGGANDYKLCSLYDVLLQCLVVLRSFGLFILRS